MKSIDIEKAGGRESGRARLSRERDRLIERLRETEAQVEAAHADARLLQELSGRLIREQDIAELYDAILAAAVAIMNSESASLQLLYPVEGAGQELHLLAHRGFDVEAAKFWDRVRLDSSSSCGESLRTGSRVIVPDVHKCEFMTGSDDLAHFFRLDIAAVQTTPLMSRSGQLLGMISTHWREPRTPADRELGLLDVIARQAADLIERAQSRQQLVTDVSERKRTEAILTEQKNLLEEIAKGSPLEECLADICAAVTRLNHGLRAVIRLAQADSIPANAARQLSRTYGHEISGTVVDELVTGLGGAAAFHGPAAGCSDITRDDRFAPEARHLLAASGVRACYAVPVSGGDGEPLALLLLCFDRARDPDQWELRVAAFAADAAKIVIERDRSNRFLQQREHQYRTLFRSIDEGFCVIEMLCDDAGEPVDYRFLETNPAFDRQSGLSGVTGRTALELDLEAKWIRAFGRIAATGESEHFVAQSQVLGRWFDIYAFHLGENGSSRVAVLFEDITEARRAEEMMLHASRRDAFRGALADALRPVNDAVTAQYQAARVLGEHLLADRVFFAEADEAGAHVVIYRDYVRGVASLAGRYRLSDFGASVVDELRAGRDLVIEDVVASAGKLGLSESERSAYGRLGARAILAVPLLRHGRLVGYLGLHGARPRKWSELDLELAGETAERGWAALERARAEEALRANEERLRLTFAAASIGAWELDLKSKDAPVHSLQHDQIFGYETQAERWSFETLLSHVHPDDRDMVVESFEEALRTRAWSCECRIVRTDGRERWITLQGAFYDDGDGRPSRAIGIVKDVTERKQAEEALREADRRKDEFLATLAHELRNPLAPIRSGLELLRMLGDSREVVNDTLRRMETQTGHLVRLVDDLLDLSRVTSGKVTLRKELLELRQVVQNAVEAARPELTEAGHKMHVSLPDEPLFVDADSTRLSQILSNLITNAGKYSRRGGNIRLSAERKEGEVVIGVRDDGIGIPAAMLDRIFDMFVQGEHAGGGIQAGLGIGLTLVKRLVEMHGGSIRAYSEGAGKGSEFEVRLPVAVPAPGQREEPAATAPPPRRLKVLVADDNEDAVLLLSAVVEMLGHEVCAATDGRQAVELARELKPDLILMDLGMPRLDGIEAARRIRREPWGRKAVLVAITGWGQEEDVQRSKEAGFNLHVTKPVEAQALRDILSSNQVFGSS